MEQINNDKQIAILMATYNGERYLRKQIDSILQQTYNSWHLYIHDDGSTDNTISIIQEYMGEHSQQITLLDYPPQRGAMRNFMSMTERVESEYYMFSDQDDVWKDNKIEEEIKRMIKETACRDSNTPIIVFSDLYIVDANLNKISNSFQKYSGIYPEFLSSYEKLAACNLITGNTMLFNHAVKNVIKHPYTEATMHDTWITLCTAKANGVLAYIQEPLVYYRQHNNNTIGAKDARTLTISYRIKNLNNIFILNCATYRMLQSLGYGSILKFIYNKIKYKSAVYLKRHTS